MGANLIKGLNWGVLEECKYQNIPETMAGTPSPPTRGDLESYKKKKQKRRPRTFWFDKGGHAMIFFEKKPERLPHSKRCLWTNCLPVVE